MDSLAETTGGRVFADWIIKCGAADFALCRPIAGAMLYASRLWEMSRQRAAQARAKVALSMPKCWGKPVSLIRERSSDAPCVRIAVLLVTACEGSFVRPEDLGRKTEINKSYEARDTCLKHQAVADGTAGVDPAMLAQPQLSHARARPTG